MRRLRWASGFAGRGFSIAAALGAISVLAASGWAAGETKTAQPCPSGISGMIAYLDDSAELVRGAAARALGNLCAVEAVPSLVTHLEDQSPNVQMACIGALASIGDARAVKPLLGKSENGLKSVRCEAILAVGRFRNRSATPVLTKLLSDYDNGIRASAVEALGMIGDSLATDSVWKLLLDGNRRTRSAAIIAIARLHAPGAEQTLTRMLDEWDAEYRRAAAIGLGILKDASAEDRLLLLLKDTYPMVRAAAVHALGDIGKDTSFEPILRQSGDWEPEVRVEIASAIPKFQDREKGARVLLKYLDDGDPTVRGAAYRSLGSLRLAEYLAKVINGIYEWDEAARSSAVEALGDYRAQAAVKPLIIVLKGDGSPAIRCCAARSLGAIGDPSAIPSLREALNDWDACVGMQALSSLKLLGAKI